MDLSDGGESPLFERRSRCGLIRRKRAAPHVCLAGSAAGAVVRVSRTKGERAQWRAGVREPRVRRCAHPGPRRTAEPMRSTMPTVSCPDLCRGRGGAAVWHSCRCGELPATTTARHRQVPNLCGLMRSAGARGSVYEFNPGVANRRAIDFPRPLAATATCRLAPARALYRRARARWDRQRALLAPEVQPADLPKILR